jgi:hypothetical protein
MGAAEFRDVLAAIGWTPATLSHRLGCDERMVRRWASGRYAVPVRVAEWLCLVATTLRDLPPPVDWQWGSRAGVGVDSAAC